MRFIQFGLAVSLLFATAGCTANKKFRAKSEKHTKLEVYGGYHPQEVGLGFRKIYPQLEDCHKQNGTPSGRVVLQYKIVSTDGHLEDVSLLKDGVTIRNAGFEGCVVKAVESLKYDKLNAGNDSKVIYPLNFPLQ